MRSTLAALPLLAALVAAGESAAQSDRHRPRVTITPSYGYATLSPVYEHDSGLGETSNPSFPELGTFELRHLTRVKLRDAHTLGARIAVALGSRWSVYADGGFGETEFDHTFQSGAYKDGELVSGQEAQSHLDASVTTVSLGVARRFPLGGATELETGAGAALNRLRLDKPECPPFGGCSDFYPEGIRWEEKYDIPSLSGTLVLRQRVLGRIGFEGRASYSAGRADTEKFVVDLIPEYDEYEGPRRTTVRVARLSAGLSVGF